jgi:hypothetical protein
LARRLNIASSVMVWGAGADLVSWAAMFMMLGP